MVSDFPGGLTCDAVDGAFATRSKVQVIRPGGRREITRGADREISNN